MVKEELSVFELSTRYDKFLNMKLILVQLLYVVTIIYCIGQGLYYWYLYDSLGWFVLIKVGLGCSFVSNAYSVFTDLRQKNVLPAYRLPFDFFLIIQIYTGFLNKYNWQVNLYLSFMSLGVILQIYKSICYRYMGIYDEKIIRQKLNLKNQ